MGFIQRMFTLPSAMTPKVPDLPPIPDVKVPPPPDTDIKMPEPTAPPAAPLDPSVTAAAQRARRGKPAGTGTTSLVLTDARVRKDEQLGPVNRPELLGTPTLLGR